MTATPNPIPAPLDAWDLLMDLRGHEWAQGLDWAIGRAPDASLLREAEQAGCVRRANLELIRRASETQPALLPALLAAFDNWETAKLLHLRDQASRRAKRGWLTWYAVLAALLALLAAATVARRNLEAPSMPTPPAQGAK